MQRFPLSASSRATLVTPTVPEPDSVVFYESYPGGTPMSGKVCVFGNPDSPKMVLMCAGFPDDHTVFLPFAKALSEKGNALLGVVCLPGFDDRPDDGVPWQSHPRKGFTIDETVASLREASKALQAVSTHEHPEFIGIFHDWGSLSGTLWAQRLEQESMNNSSLILPNKLILFDVLLGPSPSMPDTISHFPRNTIYQNLCSLYMPFLGIVSWIQSYLPRQLAVVFLVFGQAFLKLTTLVPLYDFDFESTQGIYGDKRPGLLRILSMTYMYRQIFIEIFDREKSNALHLHENWKTMPILYLYGKKKKALYHSFQSLAMLEREAIEKRSLSRVVELEGAGHWLYIQEPEICLSHVLDFVLAENTFVS